MTHKNSGQFFALDAKTGKTLWTSAAARRRPTPPIVRAGDLLFVLKDDAELIVAQASAGGFEPVKTLHRRRQRDLGAADGQRQPDVRQGHERR